MTEHDHEHEPVDLDALTHEDLAALAEPEPEPVEQFHGFGPWDIAEVCHEANRVVQRLLRETPSPAWSMLDVETRLSAVDGVMNRMLHGATPEQSHENWVKFKAEHGWVYGPEKNLEQKTHPCLVPYDELPEEQRLKDRLFLGIVEALQHQEQADG